MKRAGAIAISAAVLMFAAWLYYTCAVNNSVNFLTPGPGNWITYPSPPQLETYSDYRIITIFRREFTLKEKTSPTTLKWRCFKEGELFVNGQFAANASSNNWKETMSLDVGSLLQVGTNRLEVRVKSIYGPPCLILFFEAGNISLESDSAWTCSMAGAVWRPAKLASQPAEPAPGNWLYGSETTSEALARTWPVLAGFAGIVLMAFFSWQKLQASLPSKTPLALFLIAAAAWILLLLHNLPNLPGLIGFDAKDHLLYVQFVQEHHSLPDARNGWEYFQAPLYYILGAAWLAAFGTPAWQPTAPHILGLLNIVLVALEFTALWRALLILFPDKRSWRALALLVAAFLPAQLYLTHFPTNELLCAVATTITFWLCLAVLTEENPRPAQFAWLGLALGINLNCKASAVVAAAVVGAALVAKFALDRTKVALALKRLAICFGLCVLIGVWHYLRLWREFGNPLVGNWDAAVAPAWWQQPGYHTPKYYLSFGRALSQPYFSAFSSFWDCLYSTWWGDGLIGGSTRIFGRPPWNYNFMTVDYLLALGPSILMLTGFAVALREAFQKKVVWIFLTGAFVLYLFAIFGMTLKIPIYGQGKSFYGLQAILPFAAFVTLGFNAWAQRFRWIRPLLVTWIGVWILTTCTALWIRPNTVATNLASAEWLFNINKQASRPYFENVVAMEPGNAPAIVALAELDPDQNRAISNLQHLAEHTNDVTIDVDLAFRLGQQGQTNEALIWAKKACDLNMNFPSAPVLLCSLSLRAGQDEQAAWAGSWALRVYPQVSGVQFNTGLALMRLKRYDEAAARFADAVEYEPKDPVSHFWHGMALWNLPEQQSAARDEVSAAVRLAPQNTRWKAALDEMQMQLRAK